MKGRVIKSTGSWYRVLLEDNSEVDTRLRGKFKLENKKVTNPIAVGDVVEVIPADKNEEVPVIDKIYPRENYIIRKSVKKSAQHHILATNIDLAVLIATFSRPKTSIGFIDRYLVTAETFRIPGLIVFNKKDLMSEEEFEKQDVLAETYERIGYETLLISALEKKDVEVFREKIRGKTVLIAGHSGVGKSTLLNQLAPDISQRTAEVSDFANKGVHTTTFAEMFFLGDNTFLIDTPGIKELGLAEVYEEELDHYFPEMREYLGQCRFNNCTHVHEPGCVIKEKVDSCEIPYWRYESYLSMLFGEGNRA
jgi:ribosome biogenesis GTPase